MNTKSLQFKKAMRAALFVLLLCVAGMTKSYAYDFSAVCETGQTLYYNITDSINHYVSLTAPECCDYPPSWSDYTKPSGDITLPTNVDYDGVTYTVTSIDDMSFQDCCDLTGSLAIPNSVSVIGNGAFSGCSGLSGNLDIPNSVTLIYSNAFAHCNGLTSVTIGNSVSVIGNGAFYGCSGLSGNLDIPNSVTLICNYAFEYCTGLTSLTIGNSVSAIGNGAFFGCSGLTGSLTLPNSLTTIGGDISYTGDVTTCNCSTGSGNIGVPPTPGPGLEPSTWIGAFSGCSGLTGGLEIPNSVTSIGDWSFYGCSGFTGSLIIGNSVTTIGAGAFKNCSGFTGSLEIPNSVVSIGGGCTIALASEGTPLGAFSDCSGFSGSLTIGNSVTSIGSYAFSGCSGFTGSLIIGNSVTTIGAGAFKDCSGFTGSLVIPNSVISIGGGSYYSFTPSPGPKSRGAFHGCCGLTSLTIGNSVTTIGDYAFSDCSGLISMTILADNPPTLGNNAFSSVDKSIPVYVPCGAKEAYQNASGWNEFTNILELCTQTQTTALVKGWNWYSTYIEQEDIDGLGQLENSIGIPNVRIESQDGDYVRSKERNGRTVWIGALTSINNEEMYKIGTKTACTATMEGIATDPANHPITINRGWNWIGFPCDHSVSVNEAMSGFSPKKNDMIKGRNGSATYSNGTWSGTLNTLEPGQGYMYGSKSNVTKTLVFQTGNRGEATLANITPENNFYQPVDDYADNMTLTAVIELDGEELHSEDYELAAFVGDECRGSVKLMYVESLNRYVAFLTVFGDEAEDMHFVLTDGATSDLSADYMTYATDGIVGTLDEPVVLRFGATDVNENALANVRIYPNPSNGVFNVEGVGIRKVEVTNAYGQVILSEEVKNDNLQINLSDKAAGAYLLRVVTDRGVTTKKLIKE